ncbi:hypothetical protein DFH28DRAFT_1084303 [Melampsora americana]|nr:hypothetical protein DFH28DRAFT_1084303 [Melampsora americana]
MWHKISFLLMAMSVLHTSSAIPMDGSPLLVPLLEVKDSDSLFKATDYSTSASHIGVGPLTFGFMKSINPEVSIQSKFKGLVLDNVYDVRYSPSIKTLEMYKGIALRFIYSQKNEQIKNLALRFLNSGGLFLSRNLDWDPKSTKESIVPCIIESLNVLDSPSLKPRERLWILAILLRIKPFLSNGSGSYLKDFRHGLLVTRGEAELSLLEGQEKAIEAEIEHMFDSRNDHHELDIHNDISNIVLREPLGRIKVINEFKIYILTKNGGYTPTGLMKEIHDDFLSLSVPVKTKVSKKLIEKIQSLICSNYQSTLSEKAFADSMIDHLFQKHTWIFKGPPGGLQESMISKPTLSWVKEDGKRAVCHLRCISPSETEINKEALSVLKPFENFESAEVEDFKKALSSLSYASVENGVKILNSLSVAAWFRKEFFETFKQFFQDLSPIPLNFAKILQQTYPGLNPSLPKINSANQIFYFNDDLIPSSRRVILEDMLVKTKTVQPKIFEKYKDSKWTVPRKSNDSKLNSLLSTLMEIYQEEIFKRYPDHKLLLLEYIIQLQSYSFNGSEHLDHLLQNQIKDPEAEVNFLTNAEHSRLMSGISPLYTKLYIRRIRW